MQTVLHATLSGGVRMDIHVFDKELSYIDNIDMLTSLIWTRRYYTAGKFELHCPITSHNISTLARNNLIWKQDSNEVGIIEYRRLYTDENGEEIITVVGRMLTSILDRRILYTTEQHINKNVEIIMRNMVDRNCISTSAKRKLPVLLGEWKDIRNVQIIKNPMVICWRSSLF